MPTITQVYDYLRPIGLAQLGSGLNAAVYVMGASACGTSVDADRTDCQAAIERVATGVAPILIAGPPAVPNLEVAKDPSLAPADGMLKVESLLLAYTGETFDYMKAVIAASGLTPVTDQELGERLSGMLPLVKFAEGTLVTYTPPDWYETWLADVASTNLPLVSTVVKEEIVRDQVIADAQLWADSYLPIARDAVLLDRIAFAFATAAVGSVPEPVAVPRKRSSGLAWLLAAGAAAVALAKAKAFG